MAAPYSPRFSMTLVRLYGAIGWANGQALIDFMQDQSSTASKSESRETFFDINELPDDLLAEVITFATKSSKPNRNPEVPVQIELSLVCRRWRDLILHSPLLWTDIFISTSSLSNASIFFERSQTALIDVTCSSVVNGHSAHTAYISMISSTIARHISRLRSLDIDVSEPSEVTYIFLQWKDLEAPNLKSLHICSTPYPYMTFLTSYEPENEFPSWIVANALSSIRLEGIESQHFPPLPSLTSLDLDKTKLCPQQFCNILNNCPRLENLVIRRFGSPHELLDWEIPYTQPLMEAQSLRSLAINIENDHTDTCACALPFLSMQNLQYLEVSYYWSHFTDHHASILSHWKNLPKLQTLRIHSISFWANDMSFLAALPNTTVLEIVGFPKSENTVLLEILNLSNLRSISLDLSSPRFPQNNIDLDEFHEDVVQHTPTLSCPVSLYCRSSEHEQGKKLREDLGTFFTVQSSPPRKGILDGYLARNSFEDDDTLLNRLWGIDGSSDDEFEYETEDFDDEFDYESFGGHDFDDEGDFEGDYFF
ncbi:hypothetical protein NLJ89_g6065 [Agrocybe chaxingu]|uniref:F-box domain-containing protein n=1 Tax=Agrocybe chaxingu TaxID=84603 RepID=A0A9W8JZW2_9AGAR|nr:hypothetical protein NLJ89_g6065 [Agrocybe chaxingu]